MKYFNTFICFCVLFFIVGCSGIKIRHDYAPNTNFSDYKSFSWYSPLENTGIDTINMDRIQNSVNTQLTANGYTLNKDNPDFLIAVHFSTKEKIQVRDTSVGVRYKRSYMSTGVSTTQYEEGTLVLDFIDAKSETLIWRGSAKGKLKDQKTPEKRAKGIDKVILKILKNFPPEA